MYKEFMNELKKHLVINEDRTIETRNSRQILEASKRFFTSRHPELVKEIEKKYRDTFYNVLKSKILPLSIVMVANGQIDDKHFLEKIRDADPSQKFIVDFVPEDQFLKMVDEDFYKIWHEYSPVPDEVIVSGISLKMPSESQVKVINTVLESAGIGGSYEDIFKAVCSVGEINKLLDESNLANKKAEKDIEDLKKRLADISMKMSLVPVQSLEVKSSGEVPSGKLTTKMLKEIFPSTSSEVEVPYWEWDGKHPLVPEIDADYIFREDLLLRVIYAIISNKRMYIHGHTGSGKTTLIQQVAARLNWPSIRINFDSEITRMDLIGKDVLINKDGKVVSEFQEGLIPQMMSQPCIAIFDEIDFCRPDVAYVMQSTTEGNSLRLTEDGGREVKPHPMFRMFATGNTVGQGDEMGMYQGARPQSLAFLDRFTIWAKVDYLNEKQRLNLIKNHAPSLDTNIVETINKYATEHIEGFLEAKILQPLSPRGILAIADATVFFTSIISKNPLKDALYMTVLDRCNNSDYAVLQGVIDRVTK